MVDECGDGSQSFIIWALWLFLCPLGWWCLKGVLVIGEGGIFNGKRGVLRVAFGRKSDDRQTTETA